MTHEITCPPAINFHVYEKCDSKCTFCFATFADVRRRASLEESIRLLEVLREAGARKINFAGGEPTLHPHIGRLLEAARALGFVTSIVTNGWKLGKLLDRHPGVLDWVGLSCDSADEATQLALGRGRGNHVARTVALADRCHAEGIRLKLNTVVTSLTWGHDMRALVRRIRPERWKIFQVLRVEGQNDGRVEPLLIEPWQFRAFVERHAELSAEGITLVPEDNEAMTDSYAMIDPTGRFFGDTDGKDRRSRPILEVGVAAALRDVGFRPEKMKARGGLYDWEPARYRAAS